MGIISDIFGFGGDVIQSRANVNIAKRQAETALGVAEKQGITSRDVAGIQGVTARDVAGIQAGTAPKAFAGQGRIAELLGPMLFENLDVGLTEQERQTFRGAGRSAIQAGVRSATRGTSRAFASQGLRGGNVATALSGIEESIIPQFAELESGISREDISLKRKRIAELLQFLGLTTFQEGEEVSSEEGEGISSARSNQISQILSRIGERTPSGVDTLKGLTRRLF